MKFLTLLIAPLLILASPAKDAAPPRELIVAAIGEIPVPKMKVTQVTGLRGYEADEESTDQWFPQDWSVAGQDVRLALNIEPVLMGMPAGMEPFGIAPEGVPPKPQTLPATADDRATMMVIYKSETEKTWSEGFASRFVNCTRLDAATPAATVLNLSGAVVSIVARDRTTQQIAPGRSSIAMALVNPQNKVNLLPLSAEADGNTYSLDVVPLALHAPWCPVVVIYPSAGTSSRTRPLRVAVIQPSDAVRIGNNEPTVLPAGN